MNILVTLFVILHHDCGAVKEFQALPPVSKTVEELDLRNVSQFFELGSISPTLRSLALILV